MSKSNFSSRFAKRCRLASAALLSLALAACGGDGGPAASQVSLSVLSSRADMASGGSALVGVNLPENVAASAVKLTVNGTAVTTALKISADGGYEVLIDGLKVGANEIVAVETNGRKAAPLAVTNFPITGPIFSGTQLTPFECRTNESSLGAPLDANCSATKRYDWFYFNTAGVRAALTDPTSRPSDLATTTTTEGKVVPFIVRVESGTVNRSIYRIAVLDNPTTSGSWDSAGWNRRVILRVGESTGAQYNQGSNVVTDVFKRDASDSQSVTALGKGFAYMVSSLNIHRVNPNDVLAAETAMMLREYVAKTYGVPKWMLGMGGSGGAIQQLLIAQNYPGVLDGIMPDAAFPDVMTTVMAVSDCRLLNRYFTKFPANDATRRAVEGHMKGSCPTWDAGNGDAIVASSGAVTPACGLLDTTKVFNPTTNPTGARCTVYDMNAKALGKSIRGGVNRPLDNVGVQYGIDAVRKGNLSVDDFLALNERVGGYDVDGNVIADRTVADTTGLTNAYGTGRVGSGGGGLATVPILSMRAYTEPAGDIHTLNNDIKLRQQLVRANGQANNQVIWLLPHPNLALLQGLGNTRALALTQLLNATFIARLNLMTQWLDSIKADAAPLTAEKIARLKPSEAVDACWDVTAGAQHKETATFDGAGTCNTLYPRTPTPRMVAGGPVTDDVLKCQLKPINVADYSPAVLDSTQLDRLTAAFPQGVCDYTKKGVEQVDLKGTWLKF